MNIADVKTFLKENPFWVAVALIVIASLVLLPVLVLPLSEEIEDQTKNIKQVKENLSKYAKMASQTIPDEAVLEEEKKYLSKLQAQLEKMRQEVGKGESPWTIVLPEPGESYPDPTKFKLKYGKRKQEIIEGLKKSPVRFDPRTLDALFWDFQGDPLPGQMLAAQKEFSIIEGLLEIITNPEIRVSFVRAFSVNPGGSKFVAFKVEERIVREESKEEKTPVEAQPYKIIPIKLVLDMDFRTLNILVDRILRSPHKINLSIRSIDRLGGVGDRRVQPMVRVDMDMESVDFNPAIEAG